MTRVTADLHVHTSLSACASRDMGPTVIARVAALKGLAVIAGIEITTREEAHVGCGIA
jgi:PHP family Zn ribbon phosphoesterase